MKNTFSSFQDFPLTNDGIKSNDSITALWNVNHKLNMDNYKTLEKSTRKNLNFLINYKIKF